MTEETEGLFSLFPLVFLLLYDNCVVCQVFHLKMCLPFLLINLLESSYISCKAFL